MNMAMPPEIHAYEILQDAREVIKKIISYFKENELVSIREVYESLQSDLDDLEIRMDTGRIRVGILGGRGSGKSTLANAIIGEKILPDSALIFCTSIPTTVHKGKNYAIEIISKQQEYCIKRNNINTDELRDILNSFSKESNNRNNHKEILKIDISVPQELLNSIEFVDVPGFTRGNKLHQAFAEKYATFFCDLCIVLINNPDSIQIGQSEGIEALAKCFSNRIDSTIFLVNRCDESNVEDIKEIKKYFKEILKANNCKNLFKIKIHSISAKNTLNNSNDQFEFDNVLRDLVRISGQKYIFMVWAALDRLAANLDSLRELCQMATHDLVSLRENLIALMETELNSHIKQLKEGHWQQLDNMQFLDYPSLKIDSLNIPQPIQGEPPIEYHYRLVDALINNETGINQIIEEYQVRLFEKYDELFRKQVENLDNLLRNRVKNAEDKFGIQASVHPPEFLYEVRFSTFNPEVIQNLKPNNIRRFINNLPGQVEFLKWEVKMWEHQFSIGIGPISIPLGLPIGFKKMAEQKIEILKTVPEKALIIMNKFLLDTLEREGTHLKNAYMESLDKFAKDWLDCFQSYITRINIASNVTSSDVIDKMTKTVNHLRKLSSQVRKLLT
jgi:GTPase SAR1 family protein